MKKTWLPLLALLHCGLLLKSQNADNQYFINPFSNGNFVPASFVMAGSLQSPPASTGVLLWGHHCIAPCAEGVNQNFSLTHISNFGIPTQQYKNPQSGNSVGSKVLEAKKIIRSEYGNFYYQLAHVTNSPNPINGFLVRSTPIVFKLNEQLNLVWSSKTHFNPITTTNALSIIEYNDVLETSDQHIVLVGQYAANESQQQLLQVTKLNQATGNIIWSYRYAMGTCNANALSVEEASNGELVVTGYVEDCTSGLFRRNLLFGRLSNVGLPITFNRYQQPSGNDIYSDKISRFISAAGADRYFITGSMNVNPITNGQRDNFFMDISQTGLIKSASYFGDTGDEHMDDHIFKRVNAVDKNFVLNITGSTTSYPVGGRAYYGKLLYNADSSTPILQRFEVLKNDYEKQVYKDRKGVEIKYAGPNRFALLLNSFENVPEYGPSATLFVRDFSNGTGVDIGNAAPCFDMARPPVKKAELTGKKIEVIYKPLAYHAYTERWTIDALLGKETPCGQSWQVFPQQAISGIVRRNQYDGPGDEGVQARSISERATNTLQAASDKILFPNPVSNELNIRLDKMLFKQAGTITVAIFSPDMRLLHTAQMGAQPLVVLPIKSLPAGIYVLQIKQGTMQHSYRFLKD